MDAIIQLITQIFFYLGPFLLLLGLLIFIHELGHFLAAKYFGVRVEVFSLGFGKKILKFKKGDTIYCISAIPLGGYVKMYGDNPNVEIDEDSKKFSFLHQPVWPRIVIVISGPIMNLVLAVLIFSSIAFIGEKIPSPTLGDIQKETSAYKFGFRSGDKILSTDNIPITTWTEVDSYIQNHPQENITFKVLSNKKIKIFKAQTELIKNNNPFSWSKFVGGIKGFTLFSRLPLVGVPQKNSLAYKSGIRSLDEIKSINRMPISFWRDLDPALKRINGSLEIEVLSQNLKKTKKIIIKNWISHENPLKYLGLEKTDQYILSVKEDSPAKKAGLLVGDKISKIYGENIKSWQQILNTIKSYKKDSGPIPFVLIRNGQLVKTSIIPNMTELISHNGKDDHRFTIGVYPAATAGFAEPIFQVTRSPWIMFKRGVEQTIHWTNVTIISIWRLISNDISHRNIAGVITIGKVAGDSFNAGINHFLKVMAIISINLFLLNLLPIPVLDGGHLMFFLIEAIRGSPLSLKKLETAQRVGALLMIMFMIFALFNDITNLLNPPW